MGEDRGRKSRWPTGDGSCAHWGDLYTQLLGRHEWRWIMVPEHGYIKRHHDDLERSRDVDIRADARLRGNYNDNGDQARRFQASLYVCVQYRDEYSNQRHRRNDSARYDDLL